MTKITLETEGYPIKRIADNLLHTAVSERATDIYLEPKPSHVVIRFRVDGDMKEVLTLKKERGSQLISYFKVRGGFDITEKRKPQDGTIEATLEHRTYQLRLTTTLTPSGESLVIRLLDPGIKPPGLDELGMTDEQGSLLTELANRDRGLILTVGPARSGKTTTIYSLLARMNCDRRSLSTIEDPVEYHIPFANQQQADEKAGVPFESVFTSTLRQDPDVLFLGEIRDAPYAKASVDFAGMGHLTLTTLLTSNATTAIFRFEKLGVSREAMADTLAGIVAQRLLKKLCPHCKKIVPPSQKEKDWLSAFTKEIPSQVAHPQGCPKCHQTGYGGREGIFEIIRLDAELSGRIRNHQPISEIRDFVRQRGGSLISHHAVQKVKQLLFSPKDVHEKVLIEEMSSGDQKYGEKSLPASAGIKKHLARGNKREDSPSILVVEDDERTRLLIERFLANRGYQVTTAGDGVEALLHLGQSHFDLILSDVEMPNLDGFKLLEMIHQKGLGIPVLFLTGRTKAQDEVKGIELGAVDYLKKPIQKEVLLTRVKKVLEKIRVKGGKHG